MSDLKTQPTDASVEDFLAAVEPLRRREDALAVCALMREVTGETPVLWGSSIVGFGRYTYVNTTKKPADWPIIGFSPRKAALTLYIMPGFQAQADLLERLGPHTTTCPASTSSVWIRSTWACCVTFVNGRWPR